MHGGSLKIIELLARGLHRFPRIRSKNKRHIERGGLDGDIGRGKNAHVATRARKRNPGRRRILSITAQHAIRSVQRGRVEVTDMVGPVEKAELGYNVAVRAEDAE